MKRTHLAYWLAAACFASVVGCGADELATEGSLLISTNAVPEDPCYAPYTASIGFRVFCDASTDGTPDAEGELEIADVDVGSEDVVFVLWQGLVDGLPPGDCTVLLAAIDGDKGQVHCVANDMVPIAAGEVAEPIVALVCDLSVWPRTDLTEEERQACIDSGVDFF